MKALGTLIILFTLLAGAYLSGKKAGINQATVIWQAKDTERLAELVQLQNKRDEAKVRAEKVKMQREVVYRERVRIVEKLVDNSLGQRMPDCLLYQLQQTGIYTGPRIEAPVCDAGNAGGYLSGFGPGGFGDAAGTGRLQYGLIRRSDFSGVIHNDLYPRHGNH
jgi:hypothetical protein